MLWHIDQQLQGCGVGSLCGCSRWCLLLLAGWCEGSFGVRVNEALAAHVVIVPILLVGLGKCLQTTWFRLNAHRVCLVEYLLVS